MRCAKLGLLLVLGLALGRFASLSSGVSTEEPARAGETTKPAESNTEVPRSANPDPAKESYAEQEIEGWTVQVNRRLLEDKALSAQVLRLLREDLYRIKRVVPAAALAKIRKVPIWLERDHPQHPGACYHASVDWLRAHGMSPKKAGCVEISNARNYLDWSIAQPCMVLHEMAHAYHHQVLGFDHEAIMACYDAAAASKRYESVRHYDGRKQRHYALSDHKEYFAEATEAYFGTNDFYPFVRPELKDHDPRMHDLVRKLWGDRPSSRESKP